MKKSKSPSPRAPVKRRKTAPTMLKGGNPRIAKGDGDAPVQAYIAKLPGWKHAAGKGLDAIITKAVPRVRKAVKWNSPFYGGDAPGWFLGLHSYTHYLKVAFFNGASLSPMPPGASATKNTRYLDIREGDEIDAAQLTKWVKQAARLPGFLAR